MKEKQQQGGKSVLEDKERFERTRSDQKLQHMGDKPTRPATGTKAPRPGKSEK